MHLELIKLLPERFHDAKKLWHDTFGDEQDGIDYFFTEVLPHGQGFCLLEDEKLASMLYLIDIPYRYGGKPHKAFYLYAVATGESFRNKGYFRSLHQFAEEAARAQGAQFLYCVPSGPDLVPLYHGLGYEMRLYRRSFPITFSAFLKERQRLRTPYEGTNEALFQCYLDSRRGREGSLKDADLFKKALHIAEVSPFAVDGAVVLCRKEDDTIYEIFSTESDFSAEYTPYCMVKCLGEGQLQQAEDILFDSLLFE